jgi:hypothetical protein
MSPPPNPARPLLSEVLLLFVLATGLISACYRLRGLPFLQDNLSVVAAFLFLYLPAGLLFRRGIDLSAYGFTTQPLGRSLGAYLVAVLIVFPPFVLGYHLFLHHVCDHLPRLLVQCVRNPAPALRLPPDLFMTVLGQLFVVALPEEFFFRGYLQGRLSERMRLAAALPLSAALFALGHFLVSFDPGSLAVFFPGLLFGLLRARTGSVLAGTLLHASCNLLIDILHRSWG